MNTPRKKKKPAETNEPTERPAADSVSNVRERSEVELDFFQYLQRFSAEEWQAGLKVYVYRTWPVIDRRDESHFLAKVAEPFDEDYVLRHFGSGKYYLRLNDRRGETMGCKTISIHNPSYPPKVSPDEVVQTDPRNERYFRAWPTTSATSPAATPDAPAIQELSKLASKVLEQRENRPNTSEQETLNATLVKWALDQAAKERDGNDPARLVTLLGNLKALLPQQPTADGLEQFDRMLGVIEKLNPPRPANPEPQDPLDYVEKVLNLADKLRAAPPGANDGGTLGSIAAITHEAVELLKNPLTMAAQVWATSKMRESAGAMPVAPQQAASPVQPTSTSPAAESPGAPSATASAGGPSNASATVPESRQQRLITLANAITPAMLRWLHEDTPGAELGTSFAAWVWDGYGFEELKSLQEVGREGIVELYRRSPVWMVLAPLQAKFEDFVAAFVEWRPSEDDDEPEDDALQR